MLKTNFGKNNGLGGHKFIYTRLQLGIRQTSCQVVFLSEWYHSAAVPVVCVKTCPAPRGSQSKWAILITQFTVESANLVMSPKESLIRYRWPAGTG